MNRPLLASLMTLLVAMAVCVSPAQTPPKGPGAGGKQGKNAPPKQPDTADTAKGKDDAKGRPAEKSKAERVPPPLNYAYFRIDELEQQIADRLGALRTADAAAALPLSADLNYRLAARSLLKLGADMGGGRGAAYVLYGHTLADHADAVAQMFDKAGALMKAPTTPTGPRLGDLFQQFNAAADRLAPQGDSADAVDNYLRQLIGPMTSIAQAVSRSEPVTTWVAAGPGAQAPRPAKEKLTAGESIDALLKRIQAAPMASAARSDLALLIDGLRREGTEPQNLADTAALVDALNAALDIAEALGAAAWLGEGTVADLKKKLETGMMLIRDRRIRQAGVDRFMAMKRSLQLVQQVNALDKAQIDVAPMREIFLAVHQMQTTKQDLLVAERLTTYLEQLTTRMGEARAVATKIEALPSDLKRIAQTLHKDYSTQEATLLAKMPELAKDPVLINGPRPVKPKPAPTGPVAAKKAEPVKPPEPDIHWGLTLEQMTEKLEQANRICQLNEWGERMNKHKPRVTGSPGRALRTIANNLLLPAPRGQQADQLLRAAQAQVARFDPMPHEQAIRKPDEAVKAMLGDTAAALADQLDKQRSEWASGWGNGVDPIEVTVKLDKLAKLIQMIHDAATLSEMEATVERLNRWAAWQSRADAVKPLASRMQQRLAEAAALAAAAKWEDFDLMIEDIELASPLPGLLGLLASRMGPWVDKQPTDLYSLINQTLFPPAPGSFGADHRLALAQVSIYLLEAAHSLKGENDTAADAALHFCGDKARQILAAIMLPATAP